MTKLCCLYPDNLHFSAFEHYAEFVETANGFTEKNEWKPRRF